MDTTPPSHSVLFHSPPVSKINCSPSDRATHGPRNPQSSDSTGWIQALATSHTHAVQGSGGPLYQPSNPAATTRPTLGSPHGHQHASSSTLRSPVVPSPAITLLYGTVNPPSYSEAMHITPPSQCIILQPLPSSVNSYSAPDSAPPGPRNPLPSGNIATATANSQAHAVQDPWTTSYQPSDPAATNHPTLGTSGGHQYASSSSLRNPVVPSAPQHVLLPSNEAFEESAWMDAASDIQLPTPPRSTGSFITWPTQRWHLQQQPADRAWSPNCQTSGHELLTPRDPPQGQRLGLIRRLLTRVCLVK
ncbi:hypothetical protein H920_01253 [Fukomys damarensis]|uniref:Uncharacterized protein n=1 Tax=Fukomys damarensis TaxID=885580 RepID=A0A091E3Q7_FUKDA|nr:hypothetical protein H920_01253 [Fukomys damarensis]